MKKNFYKYKVIKNLFFTFLGFSLGVFTLWPGLISFKGRKCFINIINDGSDGNIKFSTILSIEPNYLLKIKNARNKYYKILYIGDYCFRK